MIIIDSKEIRFIAGETILQSAERAGIQIPTLCHNEKIKSYGACGLCLVEIEGSPKLSRACATVVSDGMKITTNSKRIIDARRAALELLFSDHNGDCIAPCALACPAQTQCQAYVGMIANGMYDEALRLIKDKIPLPASIGRVCPHPCETACRRKIVEEPVSIAALKAFAADKGSYIPEIAPETGKKIAVVGGGPGGLTAAYFLRTYGHSVEVFDAMPKTGGMLRYGIPEYRLPKAVLDKEIELIESMGVVITTNSKISGDDGLKKLRDTHDAVVIATGAWRGMKMGVGGENLPGVYDGIEFLRSVSLNRPHDIGQRVVVVGGGNTAMDACRTAVRLGAKEVYIVYRRTIDEMPADRVEIDEALEEGVCFKTLKNPVLISGEGKVSSVRLQKMELGEPDASGRCSPVPIDEFEELAVDSVIMAIGQRLDPCGFTSVETNKRGNFAVDEVSFLTNIDGVFAIGDAVNKGADIAISAIAHGKKAALSIDAYLHGMTFEYNPPVLSERDIKTREQLSDIETESRIKTSHVPAEIRKHTFDEFVPLYTDEQAKKEASRCLECGCLDFYECKLVKHANDYGITTDRFKGKKHISNRAKSPENLIYDRDKCILCGQCVRICDEVMGKTALGLAGRGFDTVVLPAMGKPLSETDCISCGQCASVCPTGALTERLNLIKPVPLDEKTTRTTCGMCSVGCQTDMCSFGLCITRALPVSMAESFGRGLLCEKGRFGFYELLNNRITTGMTAGKKTAVCETADAIKSALKNFVGGDIAVSLGGTLTNEEIAAVKAFAANTLKTDKLFSFTAFDSEINTPEWLKDSQERQELLPAANSNGLKQAGIGSFSDYAAELKSGNIKAIVTFGEAIQGSVKPELLIEVSVCPSGKADYFLPLGAYFETDGTYTNFSGQPLQVRQAIKPLSGYSNKDIIGMLSK